MILRPPKTTRTDTLFPYTTLVRSKTAFLAEKVLGNVVSSGVKVLVLAVIVGIGAGLFDQFTLPPGTTPTIDHALAIMLGSLTLFGLGLFGPGIEIGRASCRESVCQYV